MKLGRATPVLLRATTSFAAGRYTVIEGAIVRDDHAVAAAAPNLFEVAPAGSTETVLVAENDQAGWH